MKKVPYINIILALICTILAASCQNEYDGWELNADQRALIGSAVNFDISMATDYSTRTSWNHTGAFNDGDEMTIYRQYWNSTDNNWHELAYRLYNYDVKFATGTDISLGRNWKVKASTTTVKKYGADWDEINNSLGTPFEQEEKDSLTWENGRTVRFRAWSRSNIANYLNNGSAEVFYPDYCIADWVTVSGPTQGIPLVLRHITNRIGFAYKAGNQFVQYGAKLCTEEADYLWEDNDTNLENDANDKHPATADSEHLEILTAKECADEVLRIYNKMCMPAGVDIETGTLKTMTTTLYSTLTTNKQFNILEQKTSDDGIVDYNTLTSEQISSEVRRPIFNRIDGRLYMLSVPYDMSTDATHGEILVLPPYTRFKIKIRDVNNGDAANTSEFESKEHIFSLSDIKVNGVAKYPDGLPLTPGVGYLFVVGYQYDKLTVDLLEEGMNWSNGGSIEGEARPNIIIPTATSKYGWWKDAISTAIVNASSLGIDYNPVFEINNLEEFQEFIKLINGTAVDNTLPELKRVFRHANDLPNPDADPTLDTGDRAKMWWYRDCDIEGSDTTFYNREQLEEMGYIFYRQYYPQISTGAAYSEETYLKGAFSFYDERVRLHFVVKLKDNIDFGDISLASIGNDTSHPFKGFFDGGGYTLSNVNMEGGYLFGYLEDGEIRDLRIESLHPTALLNVGRTSKDDQNVRLVGIAIKADCPSGKSPLVQKLLGNNTADDKKIDGNAYVVGCIHEGKAGGALVGEANNLTMLGCMYTANNRDGAALLGAYASCTETEFLKPMTKSDLKKGTWGNFMCNYFIRQPKGSTRTNHAVGGHSADYNYNVIQYIRGANNNVLKAKVDNLLGDDIDFSKLEPKMQEEYYGIAPWKAMNYAIAKYNEMVGTLHEYHDVPEEHRCLSKFTVNNTGFQNLYPQLINVVAPLNVSDADLLNPLKQNN